MKKLSDFEAKICNTAAGVLVYESKVLLIKHKKVGWWLPPGGHIDPDELPHQAAEREFFEESGIRVRALPYQPLIDSTETEYLPDPFATNLHWISKDNFSSRVTFSSEELLHSDDRRCEQHVTFIYLVEALGSMKYRQNTEETDGIGWFTLEETEQIETSKDVKAELARAFSLRETL